MGSRPTQLIGRESRIYLGFRLSRVGELGEKMGLWDPKWYPKNSGCLAVTQRMGGEPLSTWTHERSRALEPGDNRDRSNTRVRRARGFDSAPIKLTMPFVALGAAKSLVDDFFWSRWRFEISVFNLVSIGRG